MKSALLTIFITLFFGLNTFSQATVSTIVDSSGFAFTDNLILDNIGNLYGTDYSGGTIAKRTPAGDLSIFASGMNTPNGLAFDSGGNLFVCDNSGNAIYKLSSTGVFLDTIQVIFPSGIIKDAMSDTMIFTTYGTQNEIKKLAPDGTIIDFHSGAPLAGPIGLAYCLGELYVSNFDNGAVFRVETDSLVLTAQLPGSQSLSFIATIGDKLMATSFNAHEIYTIDPIAQTVNLYSGGVFGYLDGPVDVALYSTPSGIVANAANDTIYISEYVTKRLRIITGFTLDINTIAKSPKIDVYPNPTSDFVHVSVSETDLPYSLTIVDLDGKVCMKKDNINNSNVDFEISELSPGTFILKVESISLGSIAERIVKLN